MTERRNDRIRGCLLGGAVGDALGAPVEFCNWPAIRVKYGPAGVTGYVEDGGNWGFITDDTQMTLFTAEGLLESGSGDPVLPVRRACRRWLATQQETVPEFSGEFEAAGLFREERLRRRRAPGNSCISALLDSRIGTMAKPVNNSKGCGTVMRIAPVGLGDFGRDAFQLGCELSALTHGHPAGYLAGGAFALLIREIIAGKTLNDALTEVLLELSGRSGHEEVSNGLLKAFELAEREPTSPEAIARLGEGWIAEETLAIAVFCALKFPEDFRGGVLAAVNITGDSDSTGAVTGNLLGAMLGAEAIPAEWLEHLAERDLVEAMAGKLIRE